MKRYTIKGLGDDAYVYLRYIYNGGKDASIQLYDSNNVLICTEKADVIIDLLNITHVTEIVDKVFFNETMDYGNSEEEVERIFNEDVNNQDESLPKLECPPIYRIGKKYFCLYD